MAVDVANGTLDISAVSATTDCTISGFGTPDAAVIIYGSEGSVGGSTVRKYLGMGFTDGAVNHCYLLAEDDGVSTSNSNRYASATKCMAAPTYQSGSSFSASAVMITDGIRLTCDGRSSGMTSVPFTVILFSGCQVDIASHNLTGSSYTANGFGFDPKSSLWLCAGADHPGSGTTSKHSIFSLGISADDGGSRLLSWHQLDGSGAANNSVIQEDWTTAQLYNGAASWHGQNATYSGDSISFPISGSTSGDDASAIVFDNGITAKVGVIDVPVSTGVVDYSLPFTPGAVLFQTSGMGSDGVSSSGPAADGFSSIAVGDSSGGGVSWANEDGVGTVNITPERITSKTVKQQFDGGSTLYEGSVTLGTDKFSVDWTTVDSTFNSTRKLSFIAWDAGSGGGPDPLAPGTASVDSVGDQTVTVSATDATDGTPGYSYQWERSTTSGSGYSDVSGATSLTLADSGLTNGTEYFYRLKYTDADLTTVTSNEVSGTPAAAATVGVPPFIFTPFKTGL